MPWKTAGCLVSGLSDGHGQPAELANYLPLFFKTPTAQEYIGFLWNVFETNCTHGKYQFAFLTYADHDADVEL